MEIKAIELACRSEINTLLIGVRLYLKVATLVWMAGGFRTSSRCVCVV